MLPEPARTDGWRLLLAAAYTCNPNSTSYSQEPLTAPGVTESTDLIIQTRQAAAV